MQTGLWGHQYQSISRLRANQLWKISEPLRGNPSDLLTERNKTILSEIVKYNWNHRKADIVGRLVGGKFTNYASMGGRMGNKRLTGTMKFTVTATNFAIASYGSSIKSLIDGHDSLEEIIQSVLTGDASHLPDDYKSDGNESMSSEEKELLKNAEATLTGVMSLSQIQSAPVPVAEFCLRPENINLKGLCR